MIRKWNKNNSAYKRLRDKIHNELKKETKLKKFQLGQIIDIEIIKNIQEKNNNKRFCSALYITFIITLFCSLYLFAVYNVFN